LSKSSFIKNVEVYTNKVQSDVHTNALEAGYQFVKYNMANGASLELIHNPLYDDREITSRLMKLVSLLSLKRYILRLLRRRYLT
jgi:hypothetical protein